jgi:2-iminoacetate synthase
VSLVFSETLKNYDFEKISELIKKADPSDHLILNVMEKASRFEQLNENDLLVLLSSNAKKYSKEIQRLAHSITLQRHGRVMRFYAPLYVSNECTNGCIYCGFNTSGSIKRVTLELDEVRSEADALKAIGIQHVLLVSGESVKKAGVGYLSEVSRLLSDMFATVSVEVAPMETEEYKTLVYAGVEGVTCYQETYDPKLYSEYHVSGPKRLMERRLDTLDRAGRAGIRFLGVGTLLGLSEINTETFFTALHARYLEKKYWRSAISVSFPRIRPSESGFKPPFNVSDHDLLRTIAVLRLYLPDSNLVLSTRETAELRDEAVFYGVTQMSAGSKTEPLGYTSSDSAERAGRQFYIADDRTPAQIADRLSKLGYDPVFKDWDRGFRLDQQ